MNEAVERMNEEELRAYIARLEGFLMWECLFMDSGHHSLCWNHASAETRNRWSWRKTSVFDVIKSIRRPDWKMYDESTWPVDRR